MKEFCRSLDKTIYGRIIKAQLNQTENNLRKYILQSYISDGKSPSFEGISRNLNLPVDQVMTILNRLKVNDILDIKDERIICSYPFSDFTTDFLVRLQNNVNVFALCATDAVGIHYLTGQDCTIFSKCPACKTEIEIELTNNSISRQKPASIVEFAALPENCGNTSKNFCPTIRFFCNDEHIHQWKETSGYNFSGDVYEIPDVLLHGRLIFKNILFC